MTREFKNNVYKGVSNNVAGATTNNYAIALTLQCLGYQPKIIIIDNTHASNSLTFKLSGYALKGGTEHPILSDITLTTTDTYTFTTTYAYTELILSVKSTTTDLASSYSIDYAMVA